MEKKSNIFMASVLALCSVSALIEGFVHLAPQMFFLAGGSAILAFMLIAEVKNIKRKGEDD